MSSNIFAQSTDYLRYLPLAVGNTWVYSWATYGKQMIQITSTSLVGGHIYYDFTITGPNCTTCPTGSPSPFLVALNPIRVDSTSGNIYMLNYSSCSVQGSAGLLDSLKSKIGDSICSRQSSCVDTNNIQVFGQSKKSKYLGWSQLYSKMRRYVQDFGLVSSLSICTFQYSCSFNLTGCIIGGVVYGDTSLTGVTQVSSEIPNSFSLYQNYPNPFNPATKIKFDIPSSVKSSNAKVTIYDALGREINTLVNEKLNPGTYEVEWGANNYTSGVYFYKLESGEYIQTKKMVLIK